MTGSVEEIGEIEGVLCAPDAGANVFAALRQRFPHLSWTQCDASDVTEEPFQTVGLYDLHLVDGAGHCAEITSDPALATGVVLAKRSAPK